MRWRAGARASRLVAARGALRDEPSRPMAEACRKDSRLVNDGKADQSHYSGDSDTLGKHLMAGPALCQLSTRLAASPRKPHE